MPLLDKLFFWRKKETLAPRPEPPELGLPEEKDIGLRPLEDLEAQPAAGLAPRSYPPETPGPMPSPSSEEMQATSRQRFSPYQASEAMQMPVSKDLELISAKLDALKAILDNINQRLANLERAAHSEHETVY